MGGCFSSGVPAKDSEDKSLEDVDMLWTWVNDFDSVFTGAADPLNTAVTLNNGILTAMDKVKEAAAAIFGAHVIKVEFENNQLRIGVFSVDDEGNEQELTEEQLNEVYAGNNGANFKGAWTTALAQCTAANEALTAAPQVTAHVKKARVFYKVGESTQEDEANISNARGQLAGFNNIIFKAKLELMRACSEKALDPKTAILEVFSNIKKHITDFAPRVDVDLAGLADGNGRFSIRPPAFDSKVLPHKIGKAFDAIFSEDSWDTGLLPTISEVVEQLSGLMEQLKAAQEAVQGLPTDPSEIQAACAAANLSAYWTMKAVQRVASNSAEIARAPAIMNQLVDTIRTTAGEVTEAVNEIP